jgi:hypothetical protein
MIKRLGTGTNYSLLVFFICMGVYGFAQNNIAPIKYKTIAGIEVGAKGVKLSILERNIDLAESIKLIKDSSINTDFISFTATSYDATLNALTGLYTYVIQTWKIAPADIATVISSGVKAQADKLNKQNHIKALIEVFKIKINDDLKNVEVIDVLKEAYLSHYGIVSKENRYNTLLIDIGNGNTKGGYFKKEQNAFVLFQLPSGTKSTAGLIEKKAGKTADFTTYKNSSQLVVDSLAKTEIAAAVKAGGNYTGCSTIAVSGGIAWAIATLLFPEKKDVQTIDVTYKEVVRFRENLIKYQADIPDTSKLTMKGITSAELSQVRKTVQKVINVFDTKSLLSGSTLLIGILQQLELSGSGRKYRLIKNGQVGWITGYILTKGEMKLQ